MRSQLLIVRLKRTCFVFRFESESKLINYLKERPDGVVGKRGILKAKAPQQFKVLAKGASLVVLVVNGARVDGLVDELFERLNRLAETNPKGQPLGL